MHYYYCRFVVAVLFSKVVGLGVDRLVDLCDPSVITTTLLQSRAIGHAYDESGAHFASHGVVGTRYIYFWLLSVL